MNKRLLFLPNYRLLYFTLLFTLLSDPHSCLLVLTRSIHQTPTETNVFDLYASFPTYEPRYLILHRPTFFLPSYNRFIPFVYPLLLLSLRMEETKPTLRRYATRLSNLNVNLTNKSQKFEDTSYVPRFDDPPGWERSVVPMVRNILLLHFFPFFLFLYIVILFSFFFPFITILFETLVKSPTSLFLRSLSASTRNVFSLRNFLFTDDDDDDDQRLRLLYFRDWTFSVPCLKIIYK